MTPELETYFNNYNELFNHEGFKQLVQELSTNATQLADIQTVKDIEDLHYRKGQVAAFATIINLQNTITAAREQAEAEDEETFRCFKVYDFRCTNGMSLKFGSLTSQLVGVVVALTLSYASAPSFHSKRFWRFSKVCTWKWRLRL